MINWSDDEISTLKTLYPQLDGVNLCCKALPRRTRAAIHNKSKGLRLKTQVNYWSRRKRVFSMIEDAIIREEYARNTNNAVLKVLALKLGLNKGVVARRAADLGLTLSRVKPADWSEREVSLLRLNAHKSPASIQKSLRAAGFNRTISAIVGARQRFECDTESVDEWSPYQVSRFFGVSPNTVDRWISMGLPVKVNPTARTSGQGEARLIGRNNLRLWVSAHAQCIDLRKVDRFWFIDLMSG